jgi:hypothetical protein
MSRKTTPDPEKAAALVPRALLGTSVAVLVVGVLLNSQGRTAGAPSLFSWVAVAWAVVAPLVAVALRGQGLVAPPRASAATADETAAHARRTILFFALLESAAVLCGVAAIVSPPWWPLPAALFPLAVMVLNLPSSLG